MGEEHEERIPHRIGEGHPWGGTVLRSEVNEPVYPEVVVERIGDIYIDMGNAAAVHLLNIVAERVKASSDRILDTNLHLLLSEDDERLFDYYLANTLSLSHFEASMYLILTEKLCYKNSEIGEDLVRYFNDERERRPVVKEEGESNKRRAIVNLIGERYSTGDYLRLIERELELQSSLSITDELLEMVRSVRGDRGTLVHNFTHLFQSGDDETVKKQAEQCQYLVNETTELLYQELTIHQGIIQSLDG